MNALKNRFYSIDKSILLAILTLIGVGIVFVYSSSFIFAIEEKGDGFFYFKKQVMFSFIAILVLLGTSIVDLNLLKKFGIFMWVVFGALTLATLIPGIGVRSGGASRWIHLLGGFYIEPSEFLKVSLPLCLGALYVWYKNMSEKKFLILSGLLGLPFLALLKQPDFGSFAVLSIVLLITLFVFGLRWIWVSAAVGATVIAFVFLVIREPYRMKRMMAFLDPWSEIGGSGYQMIQSLLSFYTGGVMGSGLGEGQGKLFFLPEAHTDFIFSVIGEEAGFLGVIILFLIYGFLILKSFQIVNRVQDFQSQVIATGLVSIFSIQVLTNLCVVFGLLPTKGLALPFLSYGGSSLLATCFLFGILLNIQRTFAPSKG